jgi:hypothetical protein
MVSCARVFVASAEEMNRKMKAAFLEKLNKRNNKKQDETKKQPS